MTEGQGHQMIEKVTIRPVPTMTETDQLIATVIGQLTEIIGPMTAIKTTTVVVKGQGTDPVENTVQTKIAMCPRTDLMTNLKVSMTPITMTATGQEDHTKGLTTAADPTGQLKGTPAATDPGKGQMTDLSPAIDLKAIIGTATTVAKGTLTETNLIRKTVTHTGPMTDPKIDTQTNHGKIRTTALDRGKDKIALPIAIKAGQQTKWIQG